MIFFLPSRTLKMYIGGSQNHLYPLYVRLSDSPTGGQVSDTNMKDIRKAVEAIRKAAPWYIMKWLDGAS